MHAFTELTDLACAALGGRVLSASDDFFAPKENLLAAATPVFIPDKFTDAGKWMDGWETRRRRDDGHDWCVIALAAPGIVRGVNVDTSHFRGNQPEACSLEACRDRDPVDNDREPGDDAAWTEILAPKELAPDGPNLFAVDSDACWSHLRLNIFPDGGVARLRVYGEPRPDWTTLAGGDDVVDLACATTGGRIVACSDMCFGVPANLLKPRPGVNMGDGWETRRRRGAGHDWCVVQLGCRGVIEATEVDTAFFRGNYPERCSVEVADVEHLDGDAADVAWTPILDETPLEADRTHRFDVAPPLRVPATHVRFRIYPDGGVSRLRLFGRPLP